MRFANRRRDWAVVSILAALCQVGCTSVQALGEAAEFRATAGAGFASTKIAETIDSPAFSLVPRCNTCTDSILVERPDSVDVRANRHHSSWRPALSTGISANIYSSARSQAGIGLGAQMVFVPETDGGTSTFPAVTLHLGSRDKEIFFGYVLSPTDRVVLPNNVEHIRIARTGNHPDFVRRNTGTSNTLYAGIQIGGIRISGSEPAAGADFSDSPPVERIEAAPSNLTLTVGDSAIVTAVFYGRNSGSLPGRLAYFVSLDSTTASVINSGQVAESWIKGLKVGKTEVRIQRRGKYVGVPVTVQAKPQ